MAACQSAFGFGLGISMAIVPQNRIRSMNGAPVNPDGAYVLYWMSATRRMSYNFALDRALYWAAELSRPLVILEALRADYPHASRRLHSFVVQGMGDNAEAAAKAGVLYYPYLEPFADAGKGLLAAFARRAGVVVGDMSPVFFLPRMLEAAAKQCGVLMEAVDSTGLTPLDAPGKEYNAAHAFRRYLQRELPDFLAHMPNPEPFRGMDMPAMPELDQEISHKWPAAPAEILPKPHKALAGLPIDPDVEPGLFSGGSSEARRHLMRFIKERLLDYHQKQNKPSEDGVSGLSPYLHFGHISAHEIFAELVNQQGWTPDRLGSKADGRRSGWWGMAPGPEAFLDQLITWRELGQVFCHYRPDAEQYETLPEWARNTLAGHAQDPRPYLYSPEELFMARTHDPLWNAAQTQLVREGRMHNYLRMLWGKKIIQWSETPQKALEIMRYFNDHYALDGRDPNSLSGIFWCLGRFDRPWPEREVFGKVRYMSSRNTARKVNVKPYIQRYGEPG